MGLPGRAQLTAYPQSSRLSWSFKPTIQGFSSCSLDANFLQGLWLDKTDCLLPLAPLAVVCGTTVPVPISDEALRDQKVA